MIKTWIVEDFDRINSSNNQIDCFVFSVIVKHLNDKIISQDIDLLNDFILINQKKYYFCSRTVDFILKNLTFMSTYFSFINPLILNWFKDIFEMIKWWIALVWHTSNFLFDIQEFSKTIKLFPIIICKETCRLCDKTRKKKILNSIYIRKSNNKIKFW